MKSTHFQRNHPMQTSIPAPVIDVRHHSGAHRMLAEAGFGLPLHQLILQTRVASHHRVKT